MSVFVDTSAFYAVMDANDWNHDRALDRWRDLASNAADVVCTNYTLIETIALLQHRVGMEAVRAFQEDVVPVLRIVWIDAEGHAASVSALLVAGRRQLSLVDCTSFETMRRLAIRTAFTFDPHFVEQGFECIP